VLGSLSLDALGVTFYAHPPRVCSKATVPSSHGAIVSSLLTSSLSRVRSCFCNSTANVGVDTVSDGAEGLHQSTSGDQCHNKKQSLGNRQRRINPTWLMARPSWGGVCPCSTGRRLTVIVPEAPTPRMFVVVIATSHHRQWSVRLALGSAARKGVSVPTR
jgi:hypothetical protein